MIQFPDLDRIDNIVKVNRNLVKKESIFNPYLGINMPLSAFFLLESDRKMEIFINREDTELLLENIDFQEYENKLLINNKRQLLKNKNYYYITTSSLHLMKKIYPELSKQLFDFIKSC